MGKPTICICKNKDADLLRGNREAKLISAFVFATWIVQFLFYLNPKFQASSSVLCLYRPVCVGPVQKPHCWFSHEAALIFLSKMTMNYNCHSVYCRLPVTCIVLITKTCPCNIQRYFLALKIDHFQLSEKI